jgi:hypothetical protein
MSDYPAAYESYRAYAELIGSPVLDYESWARIRFKHDVAENQAAKIREAWLAESGTGDPKRNTDR